ncbi:MAG TPA: sulfotransferase [Solirubrobacterales bacterium]|nr:sulfotransferase [Solirubrobacterales bacterium]
MQTIFVGGTGRSGTHVLAKLLGRNSGFENVSNEVRFHCDPGGFPDLLAGTVTRDEFVATLRSTWWRRVPGWWRSVHRRRVRGLHRNVPRKRFEAAISAFESAYEDDPAAACRGLFWDLLGPVAAEAGKPGLIEMSCDTVAEGPALLQVFPDARFVHTVRDGRDAASSRVAKGRGVVYPRNPEQGVEWWEGRLRRIDEAVKEIPPERLTVVSLDELVYGDRERTYRELLDGVGFEDELEMRAYFETKMSPERAHRERWRKGLSEDEQETYMRRYVDALERLERDGVHCAPLLRHTLERAAPTRDAAATPESSRADVEVAGETASAEPASETSESRDLVFFGGPGRARRGAQMVAQLLGSGSRYAVVPIDARLHCDTDGIGDLVEGRVSLKRFLLKLREIWWGGGGEGSGRGRLDQVVPADRFDAAVERFSASYLHDPLGASRSLFYDLLGPLAAADGKPGLVETSARNLHSAPVLARLFDEARFVHVVRDGRIAAFRLADTDWGPGDPVAGIDWWAERLRAVDGAVRGEEDGVSYSLGPQRLHVLVLDEMLSGDREPPYAALREFLGIDDEPPMREFLDRWLGPPDSERPVSGNGMSRWQRLRLRRKYERTLDALRDEGVHCAPQLIAAYEKN